MFPIFDDIVPKELVYNVSNTSEVELYPEYNLPQLEVPNLNDPSTTSVVAVNEIYDLFNAQRLSGFDNDIVTSIRSNILQSSQFTEAISKLSDNEIMESIKPRNIQAPSQLVAWSKYIQSIIEERLHLAATPPTELSVEPTDEPTSPQVDPKE